jgi:hypothetical protein
MLGEESLYYFLFLWSRYSPHPLKRPLLYNPDIASVLGEEITTVLARFNARNIPYVTNIIVCLD